MTAEPSKVPVSVDYTGRDFYSLREELITRVKDRTNNLWQGNDASDFGLALIESFAYMGDLINYYIDRVANESYLPTATQRQSLLNIASMFGYVPGGYRRAVVNLTLDSKIGYRGLAGPSIIESGNARLIVPNNHPFANGDSITIFGTPSSVFSGTYKITAVGLADINGSGTLSNVVTYRPSATITGIVGSGTAITLTIGAHQFGVGELITVTGVNPTGYNGNYAITAITATTIVVAGSTTTSFVSGGTVIYQDVAVGTTYSGYVYEVGSTTIPAGTQIATDVVYKDVTETVIFSTNVDTTLPYWGTTLVTASHGEDVSYRSSNAADPGISHDINGEILTAASTGEADQSYSLSETVVDTTTIQVYVDNGTSFELWNQVNHVTDYGPTDAVYTVTIDANQYVYINFGDGVSGAIPPKDSRIKVVYIKGGGPVGNVQKNAFNSVNAIRLVPGVTSENQTTIISGVQVTNGVAATGGTDPETNESIRQNAPIALRSLNRAVSLSDYSNLALGYSGVAKANAIAESPGSVTLYFSETFAEVGAGATPGVETDGISTTASWNAMSAGLRTFISDKIQIGTRVTISPPRYTSITVSVQYTKLAQYTAAIVEAKIKSVLINDFSYNYTTFADVITPEEIEYKLRQLDGIQNVKVTELFRSGGSGRNSLIGDADELFVFAEGTITITAAATDANLSALAITANGTLSPSFSADITSYNVAVTNGANSISLTTSRSAGALSQTINNQQTANGTPVTIATPVGNTTILVTVTAADGVTVKTYKLIAARVS